MDRKRAVCAVITLCLLFLGCGSEPQAGQREPDPAVGSQEEAYEVAIQVVMLPGEVVEEEAALEAAINELTLPEINCTVDLQFIGIDEIRKKTNLAIAADEKADLIHVATLQPVSAMAGTDMLYDMNTDNLLKTHGGTLCSLFGDVMESGFVRGKQLAVPARIYTSASVGFYYNKTIADRIGARVPEKGTVEDLEELLYSVRDSGCDMMPFYVGGGEGSMIMGFGTYEGFGSNYGCGVVLDASCSMKVENMYATDTFRDFCLRMDRWRREGILAKDATDTTPYLDYVKAQKLMVFMGNRDPQQWAEYKYEAENAGFELGYCAFTDPVISDRTVTAYMWGIAANSRRPDKAMDFLDFLYRNAETANLLQYGLEGTDYQFVQGSGRVIKKTGTYAPAFYYAGDSSQMYIPFPADEHFVEEWERQEAEAVRSPLIGYMFDDSGYQVEAAAIAAVIDQYLPALQNGSCGGEEETLKMLDQFVCSLEEAGISQVIAANQAQLDEFLKSRTLRSGGNSQAERLFRRITPASYILKNATSRDLWKSWSVTARPRENWSGTSTA